MKYLAAIITIAMIACKPAAGINNTDPSYSLAWSDEFNGSALDQSSWNYNIGGHGWGNNELWPAFWMLGANIDAVNWPQCGEIDIMEHINADSTFYGTLHWLNGQKVSSGNHTNVAPDDFHVYAIEWNADSIKWQLDGATYHSVEIRNNINGTEEFHKPFFILLNLAIGGDWPGQTIDQSKVPAQMLVDYVRVYQKK